MTLYYKLKKDTYVRTINNSGYILSVGKFNDLLTDEYGAIFLNKLTRSPQTIEEIVEKLMSEFKDVDYDTLKLDALEFYNQLVDCGFINTGNTIDECNTNDKSFSYNDLVPSTIKNDLTPEITLSSNGTQKTIQKDFEGNPTLFSFQIELTSVCNERCVHCYIPHEFKNKSISETMFKNVIEELEKMGTLHITLSGGEPMSHPQFKEFLNYISQKDFYVTILSNLTLLDDEVVDLMNKIGGCTVQTSLYSMNPLNHDKVTCLPGSFEKTVKGIKKLIDNNIPLQISCPIMDINKDDFPEVVKWSYNHKIRPLIDYNIMAEYNHETENLSHRLSVEEIGDVIRRIIDLNPNYKKMISSNEYFDLITNKEYDENDTICGVGMSTCCMTSNGDVYPCPGWQSMVCGNVSQNTLKEIWSKSPQLEWLRSIKRGSFKECSGCDNRSFCAPCMSRLANESPEGNPLELAKHFCDVAAKNKEVVMKWRKENIK